MLIRTRPSDAAFEQLTRSFFAPAAAPATPVVDARWHDGSLELTVDLPGTPDDAISVEVAGRDLTIAVATEQRSWRRTIRLGAALDADRVGARYVHGRLTVTVPATPTAAPRTISIETAPASAIEAATSEPAQDETGTNDSE